MKTFLEAQQAENRHEVQWLKPMARLRCDIARCRERATMLIGRAQTGRSNLWAICDKHAEELVKNIPKHLLQFVPRLEIEGLGHGGGDKTVKDDPNAEDGQNTHGATAASASPESNTAPQASANTEGDPMDGEGTQNDPKALEYIRECCGQTFTDPGEYRKHRRYDCKEKGNA